MAAVVWWAPTLQCETHFGKYCEVWPYPKLYMVSSPLPFLPFLSTPQRQRLRGVGWIFSFDDTQYPWHVISYLGLLHVVLC